MAGDLMMRDGASRPAPPADGTSPARGPPGAQQGAHRGGLELATL